MWSDTLTKPKSGAGFKDMRAVLMNMPTNYDDALGAKKTHPYFLPGVEKAKDKIGKGVLVKKT